MPAIRTIFLSAAIYFALAQVSFALLAFDQNSSSLIWLPAGWGMYAVYKFGNLSLIGIAVASTSLYFVGLHPSVYDLPPLNILLNAAIDAAFAWIAALLFRVQMPQGVTRPSDLFTFIFWCCLVPSLITGFGLAINLYAEEVVTLLTSLEMALMIFMADALGVLLVFTVIRAFDRRRSEQASPSSLWWIASLLAIVVIASSFLVSPSLRYFVMPLLIFIVIGATTLQSYGALMIIILTFVGIAVQRGEATDLYQRVDVLCYALAVTIAVLSIALQQRLLQKEQGLRREWEEKANQDNLTGLANRTSVLPVVRHEMERIQRKGSGHFCIAMLDIDHFKQVNDTYGHAAGDKVLVQLAMELKSLVRASDIVARMGGEEFLLFLPVTDQASAQYLLERIRVVVANSLFDIGQTSIHVTFSAGISEYNVSRLQSLHDLIDEADQKLYQAKNEGRNRVIG